MATERSWRAQLHQMVGLLVLTCCMATLIELLLAAASQPVPLLQSHLWRLASLPVLLLAARVGQRLQARDLSALSWMVCLVTAVSHGHAASLTDHASDMALMAGLAPLLVLCTALLPNAPGVTLRLSTATAGTYCLSYVAALPGDAHDVHLLGPLLVMTALAPLGATGLAHGTHRARAGQRLAQSQAGRLRERIARAEGSQRRFLSELSAAMRNPLANVLGLSERLEHETRDSVHGVRAGQLRVASETLLATLEASVDRMRAEQADSELEELPFDLHATLDSVAEAWRPLASGRGLSISIHRSMSLPRWVVGDPSCVRQVLGTLIGNALCWTHEGGLSVHASDEERSWDDRARVRLVVQDTGAGMALEDIERLLDPSGSLEPVTLSDGTRPTSLAGCERIARRIGGELGLNSQPGWGTSAWFSMALELDVSGEELGFRSLLPESDDPASRLRVLVVDDDAMQRELMTWMLESRGISALTAPHGAAALELLQLEHVHLVLLDVQMPVMDGYETTRRIRSDEQERGLGEQLPLVALTASALPEDRAACLRAGMDGWLPKPVRIEALLAMLHRHAPELRAPQGRPSGV
ncbi:MAG: hypothetical protein DRQ55_06995 [Planctomycetota bacterium]|nr:MAG: hypothetical protein DRQ55_06995 [Planctomycetota bacterium]